MKEFVIDKYLSLKLEDNRTNIYVNDKLFLQCKHLLLNVKSGEIIDQFLRISSIDEAEITLDKSLEGSEERQDSVIAPEIEFWAHCSNLQVWAENNYDTRLLHRNLAFPLIHSLAIAGDNKAKHAFKEEIAKRLSSGNENVTEFLINEKYIDFLNYEERITAVLNPAEADVLLDLEEFTGNHFKQAGSLESFNTGVELEPSQQFLVKNRSVNALLIYWYDKPDMPLPESINIFKNLERLIYMGENITKLPESIKELNLLKYVYLSSETLEKFPEPLIELIHLERLFINSPALTEFPESLDKLKNLRDLGLGKNIEKIPKSILNLKGLENLYLNGNPLIRLPLFICSLERIKRLNIRNTKLEKLPESIFELKNLEYLNIKKNMINEIPESLLKMKRLKIFFVDEKMLTEKSLKILKILKKKGVFVN